MYDVVTVGEGMLRLSPPRYERIRRARANSSLPSHSGSMSTVSQMRTCGTIR